MATGGSKLAISLKLARWRSRLGAPARGASPAPMLGTMAAEVPMAPLPAWAGRGKARPSAAQTGFQDSGCPAQGEGSFAGLCGGLRQAIYSLMRRPGLGEKPWLGQAQNVQANLSCRKTGPWSGASVTLV